MTSQLMILFNMADQLYHHTKAENNRNAHLCIQYLLGVSEYPEIAEAMLEVFF